MHKAKYLLLFFSIPFLGIYAMETSSESYIQNQGISSSSSASEIGETSIYFYNISTYLKNIQQELATELEEDNGELIKAAMSDVLTSYENKEDDYMSLDFWRDEYEVRAMEEAIKSTIQNINIGEIREKSQKFDQDIKGANKAYNNLYRSVTKREFMPISFKYLTSEVMGIIFSKFSFYNSVRMSSTIKFIPSGLLSAVGNIFSIFRIHQLVCIEEFSEKLLQIYKYRKRTFLYRLSFFTSYFILDDIKSKNSFSHITPNYLIIKTSINALVLFPRLLGKKFCLQYILQRNGLNKEKAYKWEQYITSLSLFLMHFSYDQYQKEIRLTNSIKEKDNELEKLRSQIERKNTDLHIKLQKSNASNTKKTKEIYRLKKKILDLEEENQKPIDGFLLRTIKYLYSLIIK